MRAVVLHPALKQLYLRANPEIEELEGGLFRVVIDGETVYSDNLHRLVHQLVLASMGGRAVG